MVNLNTKFKGRKATVAGGDDNDCPTCCSFPDEEAELVYTCLMLDCEKVWPCNLVCLLSGEWDTIRFCKNWPMVHQMYCMNTMGHNSNRFLRSVSGVFCPCWLVCCCGIACCEILLYIICALLSCCCLLFIVLGSIK